MPPQILKCCVLGCTSTNECFRLYCIPRNDQLRELWLSFLLPHSPFLSTLSKKSLIMKRVCERHFEKNQLRADGKRIRYPPSYPSLFTELEITHGIPLQKKSDKVSFGDHTYSLIDKSMHESAVKEAKVSFGDHTYSLIDKSMHESAVKEATYEEPITKDNLNPNEESFGDHTYSMIHKPLDVSTVIEAKSEESIVKENLMQSKESYHNKKKISSCPIRKVYKNWKFVNVVKRKVKSQLKNDVSFSERYQKAKSFLERHSVNLNKLNDHTKTFILMQINSLSKKRKGRRFSCEEKKLALSIMKESPRGYRLLQKMFALPTKRTLNRFSENISFHTGINKKIFRHLAEQIRNWPEVKKMCSIVFDEVALTPNLTFVESKDKILGFIDLGDQKKLRFCDHALVFMVRGICSSWRQVIAYYFCEGTVPAIALKNIIRDIVYNVAQTGLQPIALICDQGTTFRNTIKSLQQETRRQHILSNKEPDDTVNISGQTLSIIYDPPHLIKGIRNNFLTKKMIFEGKIAQWSDIVDVYKLDCQLSADRMLPKLTDEHVFPHKMRKMKVSVCTKVLSARTASMLEYTSSFPIMPNGDPVSETMKNTAEAVNFFDKLFDSVNGSRQGAVRGKLRGSIRENSQHLAYWREALDIIKKIRFLDVNSKRAIKAGTPLHVVAYTTDQNQNTIYTSEDGGAEFPLVIANREKCVPKRA